VCRIAAVQPRRAVAGQVMPAGGRDGCGGGGAVTAGQPPGGGAQRGLDDQSHKTSAYIAATGWCASPRACSWQGAVLFMKFGAAQRGGRRATQACSREAYFWCYVSTSYTSRDSASASGHRQSQSAHVQPALPLAAAPPAMPLLQQNCILGSWLSAYCVCAPVKPAAASSHALRTWWE
jgi:hypothetical protein